MYSFTSFTLDNDSQRPLAYRKKTGANDELCLHQSDSPPTLPFLYNKPPAINSTLKSSRLAYLNIPHSVANVHVYFSSSMNELGQLTKKQRSLFFFLNSRFLLQRVNSTVTSGVEVRLKVGINIEKSERVGSGRGCAFPVGGLGACPQKKNQFCAKKYAILSKFWYFFPILEHKNFQRIRESGGGDYPPVLEVGDLSPLLRRL